MHTCGNFSTKLLALEYCTQRSENMEFAYSFILHLKAIKISHKVLLRKFLHRDVTRGGKNMKKCLRDYISSCTKILGRSLLLYRKRQ